MKQLVVVLILCISINMVAQGPWTKEKNKSYLQLSYTTISNYTDLFGDLETTEREISDNTLQFYSEYGLSDKTTLILSVPLKVLSADDLLLETTTPITVEDSKTGLGNIQLGLKHNFINKKWLFSGQLNVEANTSSFEEASGLRTGYDAWTFTPLLITGTSFDKWYLQAFTGADIRTNDYSSSFKLGGEAGYRTSEWFLLAFFVDIVSSFENGDLLETDEELATALYLNDQSFGGFGFKLIGEINENFGGSLTLGGAFSGDNVAKQAAITFGLYYKN